ncbi:MAG TPA: ATPase domain-containing protein [Bryobacteraceae bacterium]|nr:ATPase domain-containing protein [Bryobacteraceae bacterium]
MVCTGFTELDGACGGLRAQKDYLIYGAVGGGKTSLALSFLHQGLLRDETVAYVLRRRPEAAIAHARAMGWDLQPYLEKRKLILIEYPEDLEQHSPRLHQVSDLAAELRSVLDGGTVARLVFDPATPLFAASGISALRMRSVVEGFASVGSTCLYLIDTPEGDRHLAACKDYVFGVFRLEPDRRCAGLRTLSVERFPGAEFSSPLFSFEIRFGEGLVANAGHELPTASASAGALYPEVEPTASGFSFRSGVTHRRSTQLNVLIVDPNAEHRAQLSAALESVASINEAQGPGDCLAKLTREQPDLVVLAMEMHGISAIDMTRKLRRSGVHAPILVTGTRMRRLGDRIRVLAAGADIALPRPFDIRTFKLHVRNLLLRSERLSARAAHLQSAFDVVSSSHGGRNLCTSEIDEFNARLEAEVQHCRASDLPFAVLSFSSPEYAQEAGGICSFVSRRDDLTFVGSSGAAVLLAEATGPDAFLTRFYQHWKLPEAFEIEYEMFDGSETFAARVSTDLLARLQIPAAVPKPAHHGRSGFSTFDRTEGAAVAVSAFRAAAGLEG